MFSKKGLIERLINVCTIQMVFWADARACPRVQLNCGLIKLMLLDSLDERQRDPSDAYVEDLTRRMEEYIAVQLNMGKQVSISEAFVQNT